MKINTDTTIEFTEREIIDILKQHIQKSGFKYNGHKNILKDVAVDDDRGPYRPDYQFQGMTLSVVVKDTVRPRTGHKTID
jgi:hypothetical protein